jgi:hypothetical protein
MNVTEQNRPAHRNQHPGEKYNAGVLVDNELN